MRIRDQALLAGLHPGLDPDVPEALDRANSSEQALPPVDGPGGYKARYLAWGARPRAARRLLGQRGYDASRAVAWSADGMTDRARRYLSKLEHDRWAMPERFG